MLDYALAYARQGLPVFPLLPNGKTPLTRHGFHDATTDESQIEQWWSQWPGANVGIATGNVSGLLVVDVDRHGEDGTAALRELNLPPTRTVKTPRDGYHLYFNYPEGVEVGRLIGVLPGIDLLGDNGYVVAAAAGSTTNCTSWSAMGSRSPVRRSCSSLQPGSAERAVQRPRTAAAKLAKASATIF